MAYTLLELEENLARIKAKASHLEMQRSKMEAMINFVRDQFIFLPEDIYKSMAMMKAQYAQFTAEESQLEAMLNFARQNYQSSLEKSDANMTKMRNQMKRTKVWH
ncbi:epidermal growth factor receptor substrate 15-like 1-like protein [Corchorus capsularis]|uniref:Epidermal growth factor receptor substrate 15-like 1-like protein n=1 Tax=Corchorus capsularis TaxID=210143 RepID=A0A1R3FUY5_COCAP|nr:epidermal growth factor receptor substrate 15-like 1-like protein [Corchorus capsularis]